MSFVVVELLTLSLSRVSLVSWKCIHLQTSWPLFFTLFSYQPFFPPIQHFNCHFKNNKLYYFLEQFWVHSKIIGKVQRFPCPLAPSAVSHRLVACLAPSQEFETVLWMSVGGHGTWYTPEPCALRTTQLCLPSVS